MSYVGEGATLPMSSQAGTRCHVPMRTGASAGRLTREKLSVVRYENVCTYAALISIRRHLLLANLVSVSILHPREISVQKLQSSVATNYEIPRLNLVSTPGVNLVSPVALRMIQLQVYMVRPRCSSLKQLYGRSPRWRIRLSSSLV